MSLAGERLSIPQRIYSPPPAADAIADLDESQLSILSCLHTRHHDGHVREEHAKVLLPSESEWVAPFVVQLLGEYVVEIHSLLLERRGMLHLPAYRRFVTENPAFIALTRQRIVSYWDCYFRTQYWRYQECPAWQVLESLCRASNAQ